MRRIIATVCALLCAILAGGVLAFPTATAAPRGCPEIYVLAVPGTWSNGASPGVLGEVTAGLGPETRVQYVGYDATAFPWEKAIYGKSKAQAVANTTGLALQMLRRCPGTRIALVGYSQGAEAASRVLAEIMTGSLQWARPNLIGGYTFGNPWRLTGHTFPGGTDPRIVSE